MKNQKENFIQVLINQLTLSQKILRKLYSSDFYYKDWLVGVSNLPSKDLKVLEEPFTHSSDYNKFSKAMYDAGIRNQALTHMAYSYSECLTLFLRINQRETKAPGSLSNSMLQETGQFLNRLYCYVGSVIYLLESLIPDEGGRALKLDVSERRYPLLKIRHTEAWCFNLRKGLNAIRAENNRGKYKIFNEIVNPDLVDVKDFKEIFPHVEIDVWLWIKTGEELDSWDAYPMYFADSDYPYLDSYKWAREHL